MMQKKSEREMKDEIDEFLGFGEHYDDETVKTKKKDGIIYGFGVGAVCVVLIICRVGLFVPAVVGFIAFSIGIYSLPANGRQVSAPTR